MTEVKYLDKTGLGTVWTKVKGIVTPKADKVSGATNGHLAGLNSGGNLTDSGLAATNVAQKDGSYSGMTVGAAEDLVSAESVASEFTSRITGGSTAVGKGGTALVDKIKGRTLIWNQACKYMDVSNTVNGVTITVSDNRITLSGTATSAIGRTGFYLSPAVVKLTTGHKYIYINTVGVQFYVTSQSAASTLYQGFTNTSDIFTFSKASFSDGLIAPTVSSGTVCNNSGYFYIIDLTLMFGAGYEPSTVAEFKALYPGPYYDYNPGALISNATTAIETVGFNQWDEEWEVGAYESGIKITDNSCIRSKNYIRVLPNTSYYIKFPAVGRVSYYNAAKTFLTSDTGYNTTKTTPNDCYYITFHVSSTTKYANDICISLSDPSRNGTYEPHWRSELELNIPTLTGKLNGAGSSVVIFPDGMNGYKDSLHDKLWATKAQKVLYKVKLGDLTWISRTASSRPYYFAGIANLKEATQNLLFSSWPYIWATYAPSSGSYTTVNLTGGTPGIYVYNDSTYSTVDAFKASIADVWLVYEIATPEEYILDEAIPTAMRNDPYGTERRLPEDTAAIITAPFRADITYSTNIKEAVQSLPQNYINVNSMQDFLAALGTQMGGTWTMRPADGKFDFTFTPNPVEPTL